MADDEGRIDVSIRACRACMNTKAETFHSLYADDLLEKFQYCIDLKVSDETVFPELLCSACANDITNFADFKQKCIKSDAFWKTLSSKSTENPVEVGDNKDDTDIKNELVDDIDLVTFGFDSHEIDNDEQLEVPVEIKRIKKNEENDVKPKVKRLKSKKKSKFKPVKNEEVQFESVNGKRMLKKFGGQCRLCQKTFSYRKNLINHLAQCGSETPVPRKPKLNVRLKEVLLPVTKEKYCGICDTTTPDFEVMTSHLIEHEQRGELKCSLCEYKALDLADLFSHRFQHQPYKTNMVVCHKCDKKFIMPARFEHHYRGVHLGLKPGICRLCKNTYQNYKKWRHHLRSHSSTFECDYCHKKFAMKYDIRHHILNYHLRANIKSMICDICGFSTKRLSNLNLHIRIRHVDHKPQCCHECGKVFKDEYSLRSHIKRMHSKITVACPVCGKAYPSEAALKHHMIWHSEDRPHKCDYCDRRYKAKSTLREHMHSHRGGKPFECDICLKHFASLLLLSRHKKRHVKAAAKAGGKNLGEIGGSYFI